MLEDYFIVTSIDGKVLYAGFDEVLKDEVVNNYPGSIVALLQAEKVYEAPDNS